MGIDVSIAPDMLKLCQRGDRKGIDADRYEDFFFDFVRRQNELEQKKD